jgi:hypothetical protein
MDASSNAADRDAVPNADVAVTMAPTATAATTAAISNAAAVTHLKLLLHQKKNARDGAGNNTSDAVRP